MIASTKHEMHVMNESGDTRLSWDEDNRDEVANAKRTFEDMTGKGYMAYKMNKSGEKGEQIRTFDPSVEKIVLSPQMKGG